MKYFLSFTSQYGHEAEEFDKIIAENNISAKKQVGNIFIPGSNMTCWEFFNITGKQRAAILRFLRNNRLAHIKKDGDFSLKV